MAQMNIVPDKNLFIVTSGLKPNMGVINHDDRFTQTVDTLKNLRSKCPDDFILLSDGSPNQIEDDKLAELQKYANLVICWTNNPDIYPLSSSGKKSEAEVVMLFHVLSLLRQHPQLMKMMQSVKRIFKYSARSELLPEFNIKDYDGLFGKYVFKKRMESWMTPERKQNITDHLYITRFYSFCPSLLDDYTNSLQSIFNSIVQYGIDTEHSHFKHIDKSNVVEFDMLNVKGIMASSGLTEVY